MRDESSLSLVIPAEGTTRDPLIPVQPTSPTTPLLGTVAHRAGYVGAVAHRANMRLA